MLSELVSREHLRKCQTLNFQVAYQLQCQGLSSCKRVVWLLVRPNLRDTNARTVLVAQTSSESQEFPVRNAWCVVISSAQSSDESHFDDSNTSQSEGRDTIDDIFNTVLNSTFDVAIQRDLDDHEPARD